MATKTITCSYPSGYYLNPTYDRLDVASTATVGGAGVTTAATQPSTVNNLGAVHCTANGITLSDGGAITHNVTTPAVNTTYTANFQVGSYVARVNFQTADSQGFAGYVAYTGAVFGNRGNGFSYGWNIANTANARNRNLAASPDERYDTLNHLQKPGGAGRWELGVPDGRYLVHVVAGDPSKVDSTYRITVEGQAAISGTPTAAQHWFEGTVVVTVADGRLTITNGPGAVNNKLDYVDVIRA